MYVEATRSAIYSASKNVKTLKSSLSKLKTI